MLFLVLLFLAIFVLGFHFGWSSNPYDELRIFQILLVFILSIISVIFFNKNSLPTQSRRFFYLFILFTILIVDLNDIFQLYDFIMLLGMWLAYCCLYKLDYNKKINEFLLCLLILLSILPSIFFPIVVYEFINYSKLYEWQMNSGSIRIYDSFIIPIFWLAVFLKYKNNRIIVFFYPLICFLIPFGLFMHGARSALISIFIPLFIMLLIDRKNKKIAFFTSLYFIASLLIYKIIFIAHNYLSSSSIELNVIRLSTSYRYEIWVYMLENWLESPFAGIGGGYLAKNEFKYGYHAHNIYLRLILEWGGVGCILLIYFFKTIYNFFKSNLAIPLKMGVFAILIDGMFSGNFIYPASQISCILFFSIAFSSKNLINNYNNDSSLNNLIFLFYFIIFSIITIFIVGQDLLCFKCSSIGGSAAPFFWEHGASTHLSPNK